MDLILALAVLAQDGGRIAWRKDVDKALKDAAQNGVPLMLYFTSEDWVYCRKLSAGAFSDDAVVKAAANVMSVFVDADWGKAHKDLLGRYGVRGYPTVVFAESGGKMIGDKLVGAQPPEQYLPRLEELATKYSRPTYLDSWEKASDKGKKEKKPVLYLFAVDNDASRRLEAAIMDPSLREVRSGFVLAKSLIRKDSPDAARFRLQNSTTAVVLALDPRREKPEEGQYRLPSDYRTPKSIKEWLELVAKKFHE